MAKAVEKQLLSALMRVFDRTRAVGKPGGKPVGCRWLGYKP
ncbi:hypothetical protein [Hymenobacter latericus]|nr:hypothetical protein [Hymenobacter sp. YIM 151858-1]UYZ59343.1 hypothetical protein OIS50_00750 [Hymenobacter sp. YIM 151858-1]